MTALVFLAACQGASSISASSVAAAMAPFNALSGTVKVSLSGATEARLTWTEAGLPRASAWVAVPPSGEATLVAVGLSPETEYQLLVEARDAAAHSTLAGTVTLTTGALPAALAGLSLAVTGAPFDGYVLLDLVGATNPGVTVAFDATGRLVWYRLFDGAQGVAEVKQTPRGTYTAFVGNSRGWDPVPGVYTEFLPTGEQLRQWTASSGLFTDSHELQLVPSADGDFDALLSGYESRPADLSALGGPDAGTVVGHVIERVSRTGEVVFSWSAFDHFDLSEWVDPVVPGQLSGTDFDHPNALALDANDNLVVSFRNLDSVVGIDSVSGEFLWRFGGVNNDVTLVGDDMGGFSGQHSVRVLPTGNLLVYDNGTMRTPPETRAVEYALDPTTRTATLVWQYRHLPALFTPFMGAVTRNTDGSTMVGFSTAGIIDQVAADGTLTWEGTLTRNAVPQPFYRAVPIALLAGW